MPHTHDNSGTVYKINEKPEAKTFKRPKYVLLLIPTAATATMYQTDEMASFQMKFIARKKYKNPIVTP